LILVILGHPITQNFSLTQALTCKHQARIKRRGDRDSYRGAETLYAAERWLVEPGAF
jgi:hypothetical protein